MNIELQFDKRCFLSAELKAEFVEDFDKAAKKEQERDPKKWELSGTTIIMIDKNINPSIIHDDFIAIHISTIDGLKIGVINVLGWETHRISYNA